jgi:predicted NAD-dependent protein-ADP-ribosyltransferase YbiA (DUF1768 family)
MAEAILFYSHHPEKPHWQWSNFADFPVYYRGQVWRFSEAPFQAYKFFGTDPQHMETIRRAHMPKEAAALGRDRAHPMRNDWNQPADHKMSKQLAKLWDKFVGTPMLTKDLIMLEVVRCKVRQHAELSELLLSYGDAVLIEHTEKDSYWADGLDGSGKNMLGKILMIVREEERRKQTRRTRRARG